jgi:hypothetical protein
MKHAKENPVGAGLPVVLSGHNGGSRCYEQYR